MYEGIGRANDAIYYIPIKSESPETDKARYIAEAKFLRAYFYLRLNQVFKGVPIYKDPITVQNALIARSTEEEVWNFILEDLTDCIKEANLPDKYEKGHKEYGRVTKGAAYALRGKVYIS
ncbi:MAG: RagB/SusD family nutrient uptake outer membrane protein [Bacteroides sp.]|nr:RagB/SusD family nutrient uptake outer membrane protein [Bacteroides sp.]